MKENNVNDSKWLTLKEAQSYYKCDRTYLVTLARKAEALVDMGTGLRPWYRVDRDKLDAFLNGRQATLESLAARYPHRNPIAMD